MSTLFWSPTSPYVRKVVIALRELGLERTIVNQIHGEANPTLHSTSHDINPSGKIPALVLEGGRPIFGSQAILQYLDSQAPGKNLLPPPSDPARYDELTLEALGDGLLDAALLIRYETTMRPEALRWPEWVDGQRSKMTRAISQMQDRVDPSSGLYQLPSPSSPVLSLGGIAVASACWYLDFRFPEMTWRDGKGANLADWYAQVQKRPNWKETN
ncbi:hypothetical protein RQP46_010979 [Phenoliferia psychrophenolica]